nr:MAG TPA: hypothetical protein [Caudoviricetes sp.]
MDVGAPTSHQLMLSGHKLTKAHCFSAKAKRAYQSYAY